MKDKIEEAAKQRLKALIKQRWEYLSLNSIQDWNDTDTEWLAIQFAFESQLSDASKEEPKALELKEIFRNTWDNDIDFMQDFESTWNFFLPYLRGVSNPIQNNSEAVEFAEWCEKNAIRGFDYWQLNASYKISSGKKAFKKEYTTKELYELEFLKSKGITPVEKFACVHEIEGFGDEAKIKDGYVRCDSICKYCEKHQPRLLETPTHKKITTY